MSELMAIRELRVGGRNYEIEGKNL